MEITCNRCHQTVQAENCYCPACGLPQLVYETEGAPGEAEPERWKEAVRDASEVAWKPALRVALLLAVPAGMLCSMVSPLGILGLFWMAVAAAWAVALYMRSQKPAWITLGAGARIGLVTGLLGSWTAAITTGITLFTMRFFFHQGNFFDDFWQNFVGQQIAPQWASMGIDAQTITQTQKWLLSPEGRAGAILSAMLFLTAALLLFAVAGGALGARLMARSRRPEV
jgi:RNA polymerase subunit RPABC4/transcription elongation factor Spt4